jgi:hypothetical protein
VEKPIRLNTSHALAWLLEKDADNPGVRYFALRDLLGFPAADAEVRAARSAVMRSGPGRRSWAGPWSMRRIFF